MNAMLADGVSCATDLPCPVCPGLKTEYRVKNVTKGELLALEVEGEPRIISSTTYEGFYACLSCGWEGSAHVFAR